MLVLVVDHANSSPYLYAFRNAQIAARGMSSKDKYPHGRKKINDKVTITNEGSKWRNIYLFRARFGDGYHSRLKIIIRKKLS